MCSLNSKKQHNLLSVSLDPLSPDWRGGAPGSACDPMERVNSYLTSSFLPCNLYPGKERWSECPKTHFWKYFVLPTEGVEHFTLQCPLLWGSSKIQVRERLV